MEYEGGGEETRSMSWLAELQQEMFVEINPALANDHRYQVMATWSGWKVPKVGASR